MPRSYVDNAFNRSAGRVGMPLGSCVISRGSSGISSCQSSFGNYGQSSDSSSSASRSYVDNSYDRQLGRDGMPLESMPVSSNSGSSAEASVYVDNASNRKLGRVGLPRGSMPVSKSASSSSRSTSDEVGMPLGSMPVSSNSGSSAEASVYVNNASNRKLGRVGLPRGSMPVSKSASSSSRSTSDEVGMPLGSMPVSSNSGSSAEASVYVNNASNRKLGRVGLPRGSMPVSKSASSSSRSTSDDLASDDRQNSNAYVDNPFNRKHERAGLPKGSMVQGYLFDSKSYVDNALNRRLRRVGKPRGSQPFSRKSNNTTKMKEMVERIRIDDPQIYAMDGTQYAPVGFDAADHSAMEEAIWYINRKFEEIRWQTESKAEKHLGTFDSEVNSYVGSMPVSKSASSSSRSTSDDLASVINNRQNSNTYVDNPFNRKHERAGLPKGSKVISKSHDETKYREPARSIRQTIDFNEIKLGKQIGKGGFGDVYCAAWRGTTVAVKKLRVQCVSKRRLKDFIDEVLNFCNLDHPNIVTFIGACIVAPNLAIVMEFMQSNLFDALHMDDKDFSDEARLSILRQISYGLLYLHGNKIAHCDIKSQNVLLNNTAGDDVVAKITDFGLSMVKNNAETSVSQRQEEMVRNIGTPIYSAPEVLRGEYLTAEGMMRGDIYSFALIIYEVLLQEEPFYELSYDQLRKQVGDNGKTPQIPEDIDIDRTLENLMRSCWNFDPRKRPDAGEVFDILSIEN